MSDAAKEIRARLTDVTKLCAALNLHPARGATSRKALVCCPVHADRTPSCSIRVAKDATIAVRCHGCGWSADALGLIAQVREIDDFRETLRVAAELANSPGLAPAIVNEHDRPGEEQLLTDETYNQIWSFIIDACSPMREVAPRVAEYLLGRGIYADAEAVDVRGLPRDSRDLVSSLLAAFERKHLEQSALLRPGLDMLDWRGWDVCVPWRDRYGRITFVQRRRLDEARPKYVSPRGRSPKAPFGVDLLRDALDHLGSEAEVVIVEGALDCLARRRIARMEYQRAAVVGVYSASAPDVGLPIDLVEGRRVVLALDDDEEGDRACHLIARALRGVASEFIRERPPEGTGKDWGELLRHGGAAQ